MTLLQNWGISFAKVRNSICNFVHLHYAEYTAKAMFVVSDSGEKIATALMSKIERGVTLLPSTGGFSKQERTTLFCVVGRTELTRAKRVVLEIDRNAFIVVTDAHEVLGEGFKVELP